ncbi:hypothetical protein ABT095_20840 [Kitasatospora sp. NPDC002227]|uniref:hypothetical protein n=1 Tax=Kitasatospora sp. NPDC002227 TaxID=3154773 RepID=UPI00332DC15A
MPATYNSDDAVEPDLYVQLMNERYGSLRAVLAERNRPTPPRPSRKAQPAITPDPHAAEHRATLLAALNDQTERTPPVPGAIWCKSCDSWCLPNGLCRCNNR